MILKFSAMLIWTALLSACAGSVPLPSSSPASRPALTTSAPLTAASRFLQHATFGPNSHEIQRVAAIGSTAWLDEQMRLPPTPTLPPVRAEFERLAGGENVRQDVFFKSFWKTAATAPDQLRQRVAFALSQIFVVSLEGELSARSRAVAAYYDMLGRHAFGNFRGLLQDVTLHPAMGVYLSHIKNQKEDAKTGRVPDENYAREVMQLFTIGLIELNIDGTPKLRNGEPIETYDNQDITQLARVFTGFSYGGPGSTDRHFYNRLERDWEVLPMKAYPKFHSVGTKEFLGLKLPAGMSADDEVKAALDHLFQHPNVGPFFGKQLIQRLVTSNPSPAYVKRVAQIFNDNGSGVRGDMQAVVRAVLLDPEARSPATNADPAFGKVREPILRLSHWMRAFDARSNSSEFLIPNTDNPGNALGQSPMRSSSVFNFYRPGYVPPGTRIAQANMVAPEMQIVSESSVAGYANFMQTTIDVGVGRVVDKQRDVQADYRSEIALAESPEKLVDHIDALLTAGRLTPTSRERITRAVSGIIITHADSARAEAAKRNRVKLAILLTMVSPEYLVQK